MPKGSGSVPWFLVDSSWEMSAKLSTFIHCWPLSPLVLSQTLSSLGLSEQPFLCHPWGTFFPVFVYTSASRIQLNRFWNKYQITLILQHSWLVIFPITSFLTKLLYLFVCVHMSPHPWRSQRILVGVNSFYHGSVRHWTQVTRLSSKCLYLLNHLAGLL